MKKETIATVNGVPLDVVLDEAKNVEIEVHLRQEQSKLAHDLGLRRTRTSRRSQMGHRGRSHRGYSVLLMNELEPFLRDDSLPFGGIAELFGMPTGELHAYQAHLGISRRRGRKPAPVAM